VSRDNQAVYVDFAVSPVEKLLVDIAGRFEHFSDFGDTSVGKITSRYDFTSEFALRGTFSTGFRAPTLAEAYYSATNVSPSSAFVQLPPNSEAAKLVGIDGLKPEDSKNYSVGVVLRPTPRLTATLDAYQINISDRIVGSGSLFGTGGTQNSPAVVAAIAANGNVLDPTVTSTGIAIFANGLDTRTRGAELTVRFPTEFKFGDVDWSIGANYNETDVTNVNPTPGPLQPQLLYDRTALSDLETASPKYRTMIGAVWTRDRISVSLKETVYGPASRQQNLNGGPYYETRIGITPITDLEVAYQASALKFSLGANNVFNRYPDKTNSELMAVYTAAKNTAAVAVYPSFSPFGINGGYYYGRMVYNF
jgi:iron complex outermembrane recepter protein